MDFIDEVIENDPKNGFSYYGKASVLFDMKEDYEDIEKYVKKASSLYKEININPDFLFLLAKIAHSLNNPSAALEFLKEINRLDYVYDDVLDFKAEVLSSTFNDLIRDMDELNEEPCVFSWNDSPLNPRNSKPLQELVESGANVEFFDNLPEKRYLETIEDYEEAINDFHEDRGKEYFEEYKGYFWGMYETRPYMTWLLELAELLWDAGRKKESIDKLNRVLDIL